MFSTYKGLSHNNFTLPLVAEYIERMRLAQIGFTSDLATLPTFKAQAFCLIAAEIERLKSEDLKRKRK